MPAPTPTPSTATPHARFSKQNELLSPTSSAIVYASEQRAAKPGHVTTGALRVKVIQATDLPGAEAGNGHASSPSASTWLRRRHGNGVKTRGHDASPRGRIAAFDSVCVLLKMASSTRAVATSAVMRGASVFWNEEFLFDNVSTTDELRLVCIDRAKNKPSFTIPLRFDDSVTSSPGFVGKVHVPIVRLPEGEDIEQWYSLVPKESFLSLRTALRVSICFTPVGGRARSARAESSVMVRPGRPPPLTMTQIIDPTTKHPPPSPLGTTPQTVTISTGVIDYAIIVGPQRDADYTTENTMLFRYPAANRPDFPLPTKVEWFCFPGGPEVIEQVERPRSKLFSFVLVGGADGLSRCYAVCVMVYHRSRHGPTNVWQATCISFLTRLPLLDQLTMCLLSFANTWLSQASSGQNFEAERLLVDLCHGVLTPVRGVLGVEFSLPDAGRMMLVLPTAVTIYQNPTEMYSATSSRVIALRRNNSTTHLHRDAKLSPTKTPSINGVMTLDARLSFQSLVYSLSTLFEHFDVKSIIEITALMLCEYRLLLHSSHMAVLCPIAEGLCSLIYPFRWQHPYVPILPSVLCEYLQAPLPYILGVNSSWLPDLLENGRPEHLVILDIDRGSVQRHNSGPVLPPRLTRALRSRVNKILFPESEIRISTRGHFVWNDRKERLIRGEFVCFMATMMKGYRDCLFFVNQDLPVFNKRRFFASHAGDNEATPFLTRLFSTQAFQTFLENHDEPDLHIFHAVHTALLRGSETIVWPQTCPPCLELPIAEVSARKSYHTQSIASTPIFRMRDTGNALADRDDDEIEEVDDDSGRKPQASLANMLELALDSATEAREVLSMQQEGGLNSDTMDARFAELMNRNLDYHEVASAIGVDYKLLEDHSDWLRRPHEVNQRHLLSSQAATNHISTSASFLASSTRALSKDEERMENLLHRCLTSVFTSDEQLTQEEYRQCEDHFKNQYARDLFVLILMQPGQQYADGLNAAMASAWYNPKGAGSCLGESGFQLLSRMSASLMDQCAVHEDFTNARGMLQVASQYYHLVEDKHSGSGVAKKEYLVQLLRVRPICRSLDMWQHAFSKEIDAVLLAGGESRALFANVPDENEAPASVSDETFFSVIGSLIYDMLSVDVPVGNVHTFVTVMCSTYQKDQEVRDTLKQLVENVFRAVELSKDSLPSIPSKTPTQKNASASLPASAIAREVSPAGVTRSQYDLDTVIRRKMSVQDGPIPLGGRPPPTAPHSTRANRRNDDRQDRTFVSPTSALARSHGASTAQDPPSSLLLCVQSCPVLSLSAHHGRVACGLSEPQITIVDVPWVAGVKVTTPTRLDGHLDSVVAVQMQGQTLISGSRDHTLRAWDLKASPKKRSHIFGFFSNSPGAHIEACAIGQNGSANANPVDGVAVSRKSLVMKGHTGAITCLEIGRQLSTDRAIVASGSMDATIRLWDTTKEHSVAVLGSSGGGGRPGVSSLRYLAHFDNLVSGTHDDFTLKSWDLASAKLRSCVKAHRGCIRDIQITGDRLVTAANDRVAKVWDARFRDGPNYSHALRGHGGPVLCMSLGGSADPNICTGAADGIVRVWDLRYVQKGPRLALGGHLGPVSCLQRDFTRLVSGSEDGSLRVWDMHSGVCLKESRAHQSGVSCMVLQDSSVYSGSWDGSIRMWSIESTTATGPLRT